MTKRVFCEACKSVFFKGAINFKRVLVAVVEGRRQRGRPKLRWEDGVKEDARKLGERNWRNAARNSDSWQKLQKEALAQNGLLCR
jgi:hypothetical protein